MITFTPSEFKQYYTGTTREKLEERLADYIASTYCVVAAPETDFMGVALSAIGAGDNSAVFVPEFPAGHFGDAENLIPVAVNDDFLMDPKSLSNSIDRVKSTTQMTPRAVIVSDTFGRPADYYNLKMTARDAGLILIEDASDCFGGGVDLTGDKLYKMAGTYGEIAYSFSAFFTDERKHYEKLRSLAPTPSEDHILNLRTEFELLHGDRPHRQRIPDGSVLLARHTVYENYEEIFGRLPKGDFILPSPAKDAFLACTSFPITLPDTYNPDKLAEFGQFYHFKNSYVLLLPTDPRLEYEDLESKAHRLVGSINP